MGKIEIDGLKFGIYHGVDLKKKETMCTSGKFDVCIFGHSHLREPENENLKIIGDTIVFNPGNAHRSFELKYLKILDIILDNYIVVILIFFHLPKL